MENQPSHRLLVSSHAPAAEEGGILCLDFDAQSGGFRNLRRMASLDQPHFMTACSLQGPVYANDSPGFGSGGNESIVALSLEGETLRLLGRVDSWGSATCHLALDGEGRVLVSVNYSSGNMCAYQLREGGEFGERGSEIFHEGSGPNDDRQDAAHPHCAVFSPDNKRVWIADLGTDRVEPYEVDFQTAGLLKPIGVSALRMRPGAGPRHVRFSRDGSLFAVVNELDSTLAVYRTGDSNIPVAELGVVSTLPEDFRGKTTCADVAFSRCGGWVFASNRGHDSLAVCRVEEDRLELFDVVSSGGRGPQNFWISEDGQWLLCANMPGDCVVSFRVAELVAGHGKVVSRISVKMPSCLLEIRA